MVDFCEKYFGRPSTIEPMKIHIRTGERIRFNNDEEEPSTMVQEPPIKSVSPATIESCVTPEAAEEQRTIRELLRKIHGEIPRVGY